MKTLQDWTVNFHCFITVKDYHSFITLTLRTHISCHVMYILNFLHLSLMWHFSFQYCCQVKKKKEKKKGFKTSSHYIIYIILVISGKFMPVSFNIWHKHSCVCVCDASWQPFMCPPDAKPHSSYIVNRLILFPLHSEPILYLGLTNLHYWIKMINTTHEWNRWRIINKEW